jgi:SHS2 domain-containing protein
MIKIESHIADVRISLKAQSLEELFSEGMKSLYIILQPSGKMKNKGYRKSILLSGSDKTVMLIDFLNVVLSDSLINNRVYNKIVLFRIHDDFLRIVLESSDIESFIKDVKAVTYHEAEIKESRTGMMQTSIILDI